jgi:hypothetical protein
MARLRARKNSLIVALKAKALVNDRLTPEKVQAFEAMYRAARSEGEQDEVTRALDLQAHGWKTGSDAYSRVLQAASDIGELGDDDDEDTPEMKAHLARARVSLR